MEENYVILYSSHCPKCKVLEKSLQVANIEFTIMDDIDKMLEMGLKAAPYLQVNCGELMDFATAMRWVKEKKNG